MPQRQKLSLTSPSLARTSSHSRVALRRVRAKNDDPMGDFAKSVKGKATDAYGYAKNRWEKFEKEADLKSKAKELGSQVRVLSPHHTSVQRVGSKIAQQQWHF